MTRNKKPAGAGVRRPSVTARRGWPNLVSDRPLGRGSRHRAAPVRRILSGAAVKILGPGPRRAAPRHLCSHGGKRGRAQRLRRCHAGSAAALTAPQRARGARIVFAALPAFASRWGRAAGVTTPHSPPAPICAASALFSSVRRGIDRAAEPVACFSLLAVRFAERFFSLPCCALPRCFSRVSHVVMLFRPSLT